MKPAPHRSDHPFRSQRTTSPGIPAALHTRWITRRDIHTNSPGSHTAASLRLLKKSPRIGCI
nr:MAG TPA: hypothetical protein [Caudoviricetes sp.]